MVNYCAVEGCGRNCKKSKNLIYYGLPKDKSRLEKWLRAIGREDIGKCGKSLNYRVCSRHFARTSIKNKHLCADAVPTLYLPGSCTGASDNSSDESNNVHTDVICNSCNEPILGFRYKCTTCDDYDLCNKCEFNEEHSEHYMVRIPKPAKSTTMHSRARPIFTKRKQDHLKEFRYEINAGLVKRNRSVIVKDVESVPERQKIKKPVTERPVTVDDDDKYDHWPQLTGYQRCKYCKGGQASTICTKCKKIADDLAQKLKKFLAMEGSSILKRRHDASSDDDEPITKYVKSYDSGVDVSEDVKDKIRREVTRVLEIMEESQSAPTKRKSISKKRKDSKRSSGADDGEHPASPPQPTEVVFADVDNLNNGSHVQLLDVKEELQCSFIPNEDPQEPQAKTETNSSNTFCEFMIDYFGETRASGNQTNSPYNCDNVM